MKMGFPRLERFTLAGLTTVVLALSAAAYLLAEPDTASAIEQQTAQPAMVILVRHAERSGEMPEDPPLTAGGADRAKALAAVLEGTRVSAIVTTEFRRTRETAQPTATRFSLTPESVPVRGGSVQAHIDAVAAAVRKHPGGVVLVVGHSNTVPAIIAALGGPRLRDLCETQYDNLFVLNMAASGASLVRGRYGQADPPQGPNCP